MTKEQEGDRWGEGSAGQSSDVTTRSEHRRYTGVGTGEGCAWRPVCLEGGDRLEER